MNNYEAIIIGSGFSGICSAIKLLEQGINNFIILEREAELGGTWWRNSYPGAAVDVKSALYSFSFEPFNWSRLYARQHEILTYTNNIIDKYKLREKSKTASNVSLVKYNETTGQWKVELTSKESYIAPIVINAIGHLSQPMLPDIKGISEFKGTAFHTAQWDHSHDYKGKRVGVIGNGASALQVVPTIADDTAHLHVFQRTPHWVIPRHDRPINKFEKFIQSSALLNRIKRIFTYFKTETRVVAFQYFPILIKLIGGREAIHHLKTQVKDAELRKKLTPNYTIGCKRILISDEYYPALQKPNVSLETTGIQEINAQGVLLNDGTQIELDTIVYATGFHAFSSTHCLPFDIVGENEASLKTLWEDKAHAFVGVSVPGYPNLFHINGPNTGIGHTSAIFMIESQVNYLASAISYIKKHKVKSVSIKHSVEQAYNKFLSKAFKNSVWQNGGCQSWYQTSSGENTTIYPTFTFIFNARARKFKPNEHDIIKHNDQ